MNTTEIIYEIARRSKHTARPLTREEVTIAIDLLLDILREQLTKPYGEIRLKKFGTLRVKRALRSGGRLKMGQSPAQIPNNPRKHYYRLTLRVNQALMQQLREL